MTSFILYCLGALVFATDAYEDAEGYTLAGLIEAVLWPLVALWILGEFLKSMYDRRA